MSMSPPPHASRHLQHRGFWPPLPRRSSLFPFTRFLVSAPELFASPPITDFRLISPPCGPSPS